MKIIDKKPYETPPNIFYGVDITDKKAVKKEFRRRRRQKIIGNIFIAVVFVVVCLFAVDAVRVNLYGKFPLFYVKENVDGGILYKGLGYNKLYCENGKIYEYFNSDNKCLNSGKSFNQVFYSSFTKYLNDNKIAEKKEIKTLKISNMVIDSTNIYGGSDYLVDFSYSCLEDNNKCIKSFKKQDDLYNYKLFVVLDGSNKVVNVTHFKTYGNYYNELVDDLSPKIESYLLENGFVNEENYSNIAVNIEENKGKIKYKNVDYFDSYLVKINFVCIDNSSSCMSIKEFTYDKNTVFEVGVLVSEDREVLKLINKAIFDI